MDVEVTPIPSEYVDFSISEEPSRAVYDGDISDSILAKLSQYYNEYGSDKPYCIYRADQYNYYLVFGDYSDGVFTQARVVRYQLSGNYYNTAYLTVSTVSSIRPDLSGSTGYIYSSASDSFLPSRYISSKQSSNYKFTAVITVVLVLCLLLTILGIWIKPIKKRWLA